MSIFGYFTHTFCLRMEDENKLHLLLNDNNVKIFELDGTQIDSKNSFFKEAIKALPLDPPLMGVSLDALSDSLWEGLSSQANNKVAIIWECVDKIISADMQSFLTIIFTLHYTARELADPSTGVASPISLSIWKKWGQSPIK